MFDLVYRFDPSARHAADDAPCDCTEALARLEEGNREFSRMLDAALAANDPSVPTQRVLMVDADDLGFPTADGLPPTQKPFAAVLSCSDARVPVEMVLGQAANRLFVVRVAGNVLGAECLGSLEYALAALKDSVKAVVILGHSGCGAVTAATDAFLNPSQYLAIAASYPLRSIVDRVLPAVRAAHWGLEEVYGQDVEARPGYRAALIEASIALNAALTAAAVRKEFEGPECAVVYGVYNLLSRRIKIALEADAGVAIRLAPPPEDARGFEALAVLLAGSGMVKGLLG